MVRAPYLKLTKPYYAVLSPNNLKYNIFNANFRIINRKVAHRTDKCGNSDFFCIFAGYYARACDASDIKENKNYQI